MKPTALEIIVVIAIIAIYATYAIHNEKRQNSSKTKKYVGGPFDLHRFNALFTGANKTLMGGNVEALRFGINQLIDTLSCAGDFADDIIPAIHYLRGGLDKYERADTRGPWNRDLSGYGLSSWQNDLYGRDEALRLAWPHIEKINNQLKTQGLGFKY